MQDLAQEEEKFRVLLMGIEEDTTQSRETFCRDVSKKYDLSFALLRNVVDRCPVVLRKNISLKKAETLARALKQFGALVSIEESKPWPSIRLEFQDLGPAVLTLEDSRFRKKQNGVWGVMGRVRNVSAARVADPWVLVQLFGPDGELITFEEVPLPINPLFPQMSCPFKVVFEGTPLLTNISIAFKNAEGNLLCTSDGRQAERQTRDQPAEDDPVGFSKTAELPAAPRESPVAEATENSQGFQEETETAEPGNTTASGQDTAPDESKVSGDPPDSCSSVEVAEGPVERNAALIEVLPERNHSHPIEKTEEGKASGETSPLGEASRVLRDISNGDQSTDLQQGTAEKVEASSERSTEQASLVEAKHNTVVPWIEPFRDAINAFYMHHPDPFQQWFRSRQEEKVFSNDFHALGTILLHARFDQMTPSAKALGNTQRVYALMAHPSVAIEDIPALEGTLRFPGDDWKVLLHKAIPRLREVAHHILAKDEWSVTDLDQLLQVIPHMGRQTSRRATKWIRALMPGTVQIDLSQARVLIGEALYRVAARLGVVDPQSDDLESPDTIGDSKIQSFARTAFPEDILRIEEPMEWVGNPSEEEGHCVPIHPRCAGCLFDGFCPKLHEDGDPCEDGMKKTR